MKSNANETDQLTLDNLTKTFFDIFTNADQKQPDFNQIDKVCIPEALIIKKKGSSEEIYNIATFIEPRRKILTDGTLTNFQEVEIGSEGKIIGSIAQRFSRYQKSGYLNGTYFKEHGNKFFQFIKTEHGWKINSVIWEDE